MRRFPSFSVVIEWENARLAGADRAKRVLCELVSQTREMSGEFARRPELIVLYEKCAVPREVVEAALVSACGAESPFDAQLNATEGADYYGQKNEGAQLATRDYILFLDSDVVPQPGWLRALLGSLRPGVDVVAGSTYVEADSFLGRAFSLFWFFPVRTPPNGLQETRFFFANNVLIKRDLFLAYKFPDLPLYRGQCTILCARLLQGGVKLYLQTDASVAHPPPNRKHFVHRALCEGYDAIIAPQLAGRPPDAGRRELRRQLDNLQARVNRRLPHVKVGRGEVAAALKLGRTYCLLRDAGQRWAMRSPQSAQRALGIRSIPLPSSTDAFLPLSEVPQARQPTRRSSRLAHAPD